ncbi:MAG TPA: flagellar protein FliT [Burkholderiaceae bacterium]|jgi:flagellar protein FliT|nr:flagellar protein FliT [Burkholderiaceae bacterium]
MIPGSAESIAETGDTSWSRTSAADDPAWNSTHGDALELLSRYDRIRIASAEMLEAAQRGDWQRVSVLAEGCVALIERARALSSKVALDSHGTRQKFLILRQILRNDAQLRRLQSPAATRVEDLVFTRPRPPNGRTDPGGSAAA